MALNNLPFSGGAVHSPQVRRSAHIPKEDCQSDMVAQILMLSGLGPADELKKHNIPIVKDIPAVGDNLVDHPVVDVFYRNRFATMKYIHPNSALDWVKYIGATLQYTLTGRGAMSSNVHLDRLINWNLRKLTSHFR